MRKLVAFILVVSMVLALLSGCVIVGNAKTGTLSPEETSATVSGVTVDMGGYILDGETELSVQKRTAEENKDEGYKIESYDIAVGELSELSDFITIRIPYDDSYCEKDQDAALCVGAKYLNETSGEWEDVLFEVDTEAKELVIYTDHLSVYGAFHIKNEGQRRAYITDIYADISGIDTEQAMAALREYVANGGESGSEAVNLGADLINLSGDVNDVSEFIENVINFASMGDPEFDSALANGAFERMVNVGRLAAIVKIGAVMLKSGKTDEDVYGLYKDTANLVMSFAKSRALGMAMVAVAVFDYTISEMFAQGMAMRRGAINEVYRFYNDSYDEGHYKARDLKDWRKALIEAVEKDPENPAAAVEAEIDRYCNAFWNLLTSEFDSVADVYDAKGKKGATTVPQPTSDEAKRMTEDYKNELYERLYPVVNSVAVYMQKKAEAEYLDSLCDMKKFFNQTITLSFSEGLGENESTGYANYSLRLEPLSKNADKENWGAADLGEKGPNGKTKFTLIGYLTAGAPDTLALYKPGATPGKDTPEVTVKFRLTASKTEVEIPRAARRLEFISRPYKEGGSHLGFQVPEYAERAFELMFEENGPLVIGEDGTFSFHQSGSYVYSCPIPEEYQATVKSMTVRLSGVSFEGTCDILGGSEPYITMQYTQSIAKLYQDGNGDYTETWEVVGSGVPYYELDGKTLTIAMQVTVRNYYDGELYREYAKQISYLFVKK